MYNDDETGAGWLNDWDNRHIDEDELRAEIHAMCRQTTPAPASTQKLVQSELNFPTPQTSVHTVLESESIPVEPADTRPADDSSVEQKLPLAELEALLNYPQDDDADAALTSMENERLLDAWRRKRGGR